MRYEIEGQILTDIADSIRGKTGKSELIKAEDMAEEIDSIIGGGDVPLLTNTVWNALTTAQKQAYGLVAIQNVNTGFKRGMLVYGADYVEIGKYLPYSDVSKIICEATPDNYDNTSLHWGYGDNPITLSVAGCTQNGDGSVSIKTKSIGTLAYVDLGENSVPFTAYIVAKCVLSNSNYTRLISSISSHSADNGILLYGNNNVIVSSWGSDTTVSPEVRPTQYFVGVIQYMANGALGGAIGSKSVTPSLISKNPHSCGRYITIGRSDIETDASNEEPSDMDVMYLGITTDVETQNTIAQNMQFLAETFI